MTSSFQKPIIHNKNEFRHWVGIYVKNASLPHARRQSNKQYNVQQNVWGCTH